MKSIQEREKMEHTLTVTVKIRVISDLAFNEVVEDFQSNTDYEFNSTDNVTVISTTIESCE